MALFGVAFFEELWDEFERFLKEVEVQIPASLIGKC